MIAHASTLIRAALRASVHAGAALMCLMSTTQGVGAQQNQSEPSQDAPRAFELAPRGYIQLDWRGYQNWTVAPGTGRLEYSTFEVRRLRAGVDGRWRRITFEVTLDPQDIDGTLVKDAYAQVRLTKDLRVRAGQFKVPGGREYQTAARSIDFLERPALASSLAAGRDLGVMASGDLGKAAGFQAGVFAGDGNGRISRAELTSAGRIVWSWTNALEFGASFSAGRTSADDSDPANGLEGRTASGYRFFERVYVKGLRLRAGADARWTPGPWRVTAEVLRTRDERLEQGQEFEDLPAVAGVGWSVAVTRRFGRRQGARARLREWEVGLRLDGLSFDDEGAETGSDSVRPRATNVRSKSAQTLTSSVSWGPSRWARVLADVAVERYDEPRSAPEAGRREPYWTAGMRLHVELPW
jgi:phosphate-selective porin